MFHTSCSIASLLNRSAGFACGHERPFLPGFLQALKAFIQCCCVTLTFPLSYWSPYKMNQLGKQSFSVLGLYQQKMYGMS